MHRIQRLSQTNLGACSLPPVGLTTPRPTLAPRFGPLSTQCPRLPTFGPPAEPTRRGGPQDWRRWLRESLRPTAGIRCMGTPSSSIKHPIRWLLGIGSLNVSRAGSSHCWEKGGGPRQNYMTPLAEQVEPVKRWRPMDHEHDVHHVLKSNVAACWQQGRAPVSLQLGFALIISCHIAILYGIHLF